MKKLITSLFIFTALLAPTFALSGNAAAVNIFAKSCQKQQDNSVCKDVNAQGTGSNPVIRILKGAINLISILVGVAAVIGILVSGLRLIISNGDANAVTSARNGLVYSLIGIGVVIFAQAIVVFVINKV